MIDSYRKILDLFDRRERRQFHLLLLLVLVMAVFDAVSGKMNLVFAVAVPVIVPLLTDKVPVAAGELNASVPVPER